MRHESEYQDRQFVDVALGVNVHINTHEPVGANSRLHQSSREHPSGDGARHVGSATRGDEPLRRATDHHLAGDAALGAVGSAARRYRDELSARDPHRALQGETIPTNNYRPAPESSHSGLGTTPGLLCRQDRPRKHRHLPSTGQAYRHATYRGHESVTNRPLRHHSGVKGDTAGIAGPASDTECTIRSRTAPEGNAYASRISRPDPWPPARRIGHRALTAPLPRIRGHLCVPTPMQVTGA